MLPGQNYAGGLELTFFESASFERMDTLNSHTNAKAITSNVLRIMFMGWHSKWRDLVSKRVLKAALIKRDHALLKGMRLAFQEGFKQVYNQLKNRRLNQQQHNQALLYISNCLCFLPYADINPYESIAIPQWINNSWQLIDYKVVPIELTPTTGFDNLFINDFDRVFAYGLEPIYHKTAESHLVFMGTTYPAGQGFMTQVNTDLEGFETVGNKLYRSGRDNISRWLNSQNKKVHVCGASLGGSLSLLLAIDQGDKLSHVDTLNPAGLYLSWRKSRFDKWSELTNKPRVIIQKQGSDPVSRFGVWKEDWTLLHVTPPKDKQGPNQFLDHALNYAGFAKTRFISVDPRLDNESRKMRNFWLYMVARSVVYYALLMPFWYGVRPCIHYVLNNTLQFALMATCIGFLYLPLAIPSVLFYSIAAIPVLFLLNDTYKAALTIFGRNKTPIPACHATTIPRNTSLDIYNNRSNVQLTYKELRDYHYAKRCVLKNKLFLPHSISSGKEKFGGLSKRDVLSKSLEPGTAELPITVNMTQAKLYDVRRTAQLIQRFGLHNANLKNALKKEHFDYILGKGGPRLT